MINEKTIQNIAKLARLSISEDEAQEYVLQLTKVLNHFEQISGLDTSHVEPLVTPVEINFFTRADEIKNENNTAEMIQNAPEKAGNLFKVPPVV